MKLVKILATKRQLESVGCDRDLTGSEAQYIRRYVSGYVQIKVNPTDDILEYFKKFPDEILESGKYPWGCEFYDIPENWIEFIKKKK